MTPPMMATAEKALTAPWIEAAVASPQLKLIKKAIYTLEPTTEIILNRNSASGWSLPKRKVQQLSRRTSLKKK